MAKQRDIYYATLERLEQRRQDIGNLLAKRYRAVAWFGADAAQPFENLHKAITGVGNAATLLIRWSGDGTQQREPDMWESYLRTIWWTSGGRDDIANQIDGAVKEIERIFRPVLEAQPS